MIVSIQYTIYNIQLTKNQSHPTGHRRICGAASSKTLPVCRLGRIGSYENIKTLRFNYDRHVNGWVVGWLGRWMVGRMKYCLWVVDEISSLFIIVLS